MELLMGVADPPEPDVHHTTVTGAGSVFSGMGPFSLTYTPPLTNQTDKISPDASAELAFAGDRGDAGVNKYGETYRSIFLGFPFAAIDHASSRADIMAAALDWCLSCHYNFRLTQWPDPIRITDLVECMDEGASRDR